MTPGAASPGPAVIVHGLADATEALHAARAGRLTLLSAPGAALYAGCLWWREVVEQARALVPGALADDILDCADAAGLALSAIRIGQRGIVLDPSAPGHGAVAAIAHAHGIVLLAAAPPALDLAARGARRQLERWLHAGDSGGGLG
jgi:hypothetical protein